MIRTIIVTLILLVNSANAELSKTNITHIKKQLENIPIETIVKDIGTKLAKNLPQKTDELITVVNVVTIDNQLVLSQTINTKHNNLKNLKVNDFRDDVQALTRKLACQNKTYHYLIRNRGMQILYRNYDEDFNELFNIKISSKDCQNNINKNEANTIGNKLKKDKEWIQSLDKNNQLIMTASMLDSLINHVFEDIIKKADNSRDRTWGLKVWYGGVIYIKSSLNKNSDFKETMIELNKILASRITGKTNNKDFLYKLNLVNSKIIKIKQMIDRKDVEYFFQKYTNKFNDLVDNAIVAGKIIENGRNKIKK